VKNSSANIFWSDIPPGAKVYDLGGSYAVRLANGQAACVYWTGTDAGRAQAMLKVRAIPGPMPPVLASVSIVRGSLAPAMLSRGYIGTATWNGWQFDGYSKSTYRRTACATIRRQALRHFLHILGGKP
jgi:hypothetical protein